MQKKHEILSALEQPARNVLRASANSAFFSPQKSSSSQKKAEEKLKASAVTPTSEEKPSSCIIT